ncbi:MAG: class I SAM-dependent methyltransferase [Gammaproteobacteria bacterium]|jgi:16S rRNA (guanine1516-N2)-methyltransferase
MTANDAHPQTKVIVWAANTALNAVAQSIATKLQLSQQTTPSLADLHNSPYEFALAVVPNSICEYQLELHDLSQKKTKLIIDYAGGDIAHRAQHGGGRRQALAKAMGLKSGHSPNVIDATAGLGRDAFVLANLGCRVRMVERSPIMACLLEDALRRAAYDEHLNPWINQRLQLVTGDALQKIPLLCEASATDAIYIDPMYPPRSKSALVKKEMRFIQALVGKDIDSEELLAVALKYSTKRVVIKRPSYAAPIEGPKPSHTIESKNTRYDVYIAH